MRSKTGRYAENGSSGSHCIAEQALRALTLFCRLRGRSVSISVTMVGDNTNAFSEVHSNWKIE